MTAQGDEERPEEPDKDDESSREGESWAARRARTLAEQIGRLDDPAFLAEVTEALSSLSQKGLVESAGIDPAPDTGSFRRMNPGPASIPTENLGGDIDPAVGVDLGEATPSLRAMQQHRRRARTGFVWVMLSLLVVVAVGWPLGAALLPQENADRLAEAAGEVLTTIVGLAGVAAGYYFASFSKD